MTKKTTKFAIAVFALMMVNLTACAGGGTDASASTLSTKAAEKTESEATKGEKAAKGETAVKEETALKEETAAGSKAKSDILLTSAPTLSLNDSLSSTLARFEVSSGNYSWSYLEKGETVSLVACGMHPLDTDPETVEKLKVPKYNGMDSAFYSLSCVVAPDSVTVREWDISQLGDAEAEESSSVNYGDSALIELKPGKVYEITANWDESKLEFNGFFGEAGYVVITE